MQTQQIAMSDFMERFGDPLFEGARIRLSPEYEGGRAELDHMIQGSALERTPFPAQSESAKAAYVHLFERDARMVFCEAEMGCGKTTIATMIALMATTGAARPQRSIVVCPPHLVGKWAREIETLCPQARVIRINSAGANHILAREAAKHPGHPDHPEFWVIGRVRLRMDFTFIPALVQRPSLKGFPKYHCPHCGRRPVTFHKFKAGEALPDDAMIDTGDDAADEESKAGNGYFENMKPSEVRRSMRCDKVAHDDDSIHDGCGSPLWQAARNQRRSPQENTLMSLKQLPGVGPKLAGDLAQRDDAQAIVSALEDGDIPPALNDKIGPTRRKRIESWLERNTFSLQASDFAPVRFIQKRLPKHWFDLAVFDEVHEMKGDSSAQGIAYGVLAGAVSKIVCLTGTLVDGYAQSLHPLLFRADPRRMIDAGFGADEGARFQWEMGVIKEVRTEIIDPANLTSRSRTVRRQCRNLPGLHPMVVTEMLLPNTVFLSLADVERSIQELQPPGETPVRLLPSYREVFVAHKMEDEQKKAVQALTLKLGNILSREPPGYARESLRAPVVSALLRYPDECFRESTVGSRRQGVLARCPQVQSHDGLFPKERFLIELAQREVSEGRNLVVFTTYTCRRDLSKRYRDVLESAGIKVAVLTSAVPTDMREAWMDEKTRQGYQAIVCNPELVKTGLDLYAFPTLYFTQTGYRIDTILQASRRSWRIGQRRPVRVYFGGYEATAQMQALQLVAKKIRVVNQAKGNIAATGLSLLDDDEEASAMMAIANLLLDARRDRTHDTITGSIDSLDKDDSSEEFGADSIERLHEVIQAAQARHDTVVVDLDAHRCSTPSEHEDVVDSTTVQQPQPEQPAGSKTIILVDYLENKGRKHSYQRAQTAYEDAPTGSQLAMF